MKKIIFLDIDGVIATPESIEHGLWALVESKQELLSKILYQTKAEIVLSSSWRKNTLEQTKDFMKLRGFKFVDKIIGQTIRAYQYIEKGIHLSIPRGVEIKQWIDTNIHSNSGKDYQRKHLGIDYNYVILDDDSDMLLEHTNNFIRTNWKEGLTDDHALLAISILNRYDIYK